MFKSISYFLLSGQGGNHPQTDTQFSETHSRKSPRRRTITRQGYGAQVGIQTLSKEGERKKRKLEETFVIL